jgi:hypothetical protein
MAFDSGIGAAIGSAAGKIGEAVGSVYETGKEAFGDAFWEKGAVPGEGQSFEYSPDLLNRVIERLEGLVGEIDKDRRLVEYVEESAARVAPSEDWGSERAGDAAQDNARRLWETYDQLLTVARKLLLAHLHAKATLDTAEESVTEEIQALQKAIGEVREV